MSRSVSRATASHVLVQVSHITAVSVSCLTITTAEKEGESATFPFKTFHPDQGRHICSHFIKPHLASGEPRSCTLLNTLMKKKMTLANVSGLTLYFTYVKQILHEREK